MSDFQSIFRHAINSGEFLLGSGTAPHASKYSESLTLNMVLCGMVSGVVLMKPAQTRRSEQSKFLAKNYAG